jgi:hypothetical protein
VLLLFLASRAWRTTMKRVRRLRRGKSGQAQALLCSAHWGQRPPPSEAVRDLTLTSPVFPWPLLASRRRDSTDSQGTLSPIVEGSAVFFPKRGLAERSGDFGMADGRG